MNLRWLRVDAPPAAIVVRLAVGLVFFLEGVKKFLFPIDWGVGRFTKIGIPSPQVMAPFVGTVEIVCGALVVIGLLTQLAAIPLIIDIAVAILSTKVPLLLQKGFWPMEADARTDYAMLMGLLFLLISGGGPWSVDGRRSRHRRQAAANP